MTNLVAHAARLLAGSTLINVTVPLLQLPQAVQQSWGGYSPWFPVAEYVPPPAGCNVVQVNLLQRHGARFPSASAGKAIKASLKKLQQATSFNAPDLKFVKDYKYTLGAEDLVLYGAQQSFDSGERDFVQYAALLNETSVPFVRASGSGRVIDSAGNWTTGVAYASNRKCVPKLNLIISESTVNDTLSVYRCPNVGGSTGEVTTWTNVFAPAIAKRINSEAPGANLSNNDIVKLMSLCPFDTLAYERPSQWCYPFTLDEWASYLYSHDLYYYYAGPGQKCGPVKGVGYVNELLARLTGQPVQDKTQTNHTLDNNTTNFPLGRTFYADFTHDMLMTAVFAAIGLFKQPQNLSTTHIDKGRTYVSSELVPFAGRMVTEKITCNGSGYEPQGTYVRVLVNDAVQPLAFCNASLYGLCTLSKFVESQSFASTQGAGSWAECLRRAGGQTCM